MAAVTCWQIAMSLSSFLAQLPACAACCKTATEHLGAAVQVGPMHLLRWVRHYVCLGLFTILHLAFKPLRRFVKAFWLLRLADSWEYGSGQDH